NPVPPTQPFGWHVMGDSPFQNFFTADRLNTHMAPLVSADPNSPASLSVSTEIPANAVEDAGQGVTTPSDSAAPLVNAVAAAVISAYPNQGRLASYFARDAHAAVPSVTLARNAFVTLFPYSQNTGLSPDQFVASWAYKPTACSILACPVS